MPICLSAVVGTVIQDWEARHMPVEKLDASLPCVRVDFESEADISMAMSFNKVYASGLRRTGVPAKPVCCTLATVLLVQQCSAETAH